GVGRSRRTTHALFFRGEDIGRYCKCCGSDPAKFDWGNTRREFVDARERWPRWELKNVVLWCDAVTGVGCKLRLQLFQSVLFRRRTELRTQYARESWYPVPGLSVQRTRDAQHSCRVGCTANVRRQAILLDAVPEAPSQFGPPVLIHLMNKQPEEMRPTARADNDARVRQTGCSNDLLKLSDNCLSRQALAISCTSDILRVNVQPDRFERHRVLSFTRSRHACLRSVYTLYRPIGRHLSDELFRVVSCPYAAVPPCAVGLRPSNDDIASIAL